jgi:hypothetical protein
VSTAMSTRIAAGVTAAYLLDLSRGAASASAPTLAGPDAPDRAHAMRAHGAGLVRQASRRARLGATRGGSSGCLG